MPIIDPNKNPMGVHKCLETETDPKRRRMLEEVRFHIAIEASGEIGPAIDRLGPDPYYIVYRSDIDPSSNVNIIRGAEAIRKDFYDAIFDRMDITLEWDIIRCMVNDESVMTEGIQKNAILGKALIAEGIEADPEKLYLQDAHHFVIWPFDDQQRPLGEIVFHGGETPLEEVAKRPLKPEDIGTYTGQFWEID